MLLRLFCTAILFSLVNSRHGRFKRSSACYGPLGCMTTDGFFSLRRPINILPSSRDSVNTQFRLFTRLNKDQDQVIRVDHPVTFDISNFDPKRLTKFIVHGFTDDGFKPWVMDMKDELLKFADLNVFAVDWGSGSRPPYIQATANTRLVGAEIAYMIKFLQKKGLKAEDVHIIGHSLGSHTSGYAGRLIKGLGRITGLDPAGPYFEYTSPLVQLDPTDATFVDNIHTDGRNLLQLGLGMMQPSGHVDYYPNSGRFQPGCSKDPFSFIQINGIEGGLTEFVACDHLRSIVFFTESINSKCNFEGFECESYDRFKNGQCRPVPNAKMGMHSDQYITNGRTGVKFYLETAATAPYCEFLYEIELDIGNDQSDMKSQRGEVYLQMKGEGTKTPLTQITNGNTFLNPNTKMTFIMKSKIRVSDISSVKIRWNQDAHWFKPWTWGIFGIMKNNIYINKIKIVTTEAKEVSFCEWGATILKTGKVKQIKASTTCT